MATFEMDYKLIAESLRDLISSLFAKELLNAITETKLISYLDEKLLKLAEAGHITREYSVSITKGTEINPFVIDVFVQKPNDSAEDKGCKIALTSEGFLGGVRIAGQEIFSFKLMSGNNTKKKSRQI